MPLKEKDPSIHDESNLVFELTTTLQSLEGKVVTRTPGELQFAHGAQDVDEAGSSPSMTIPVYFPDSK
jgi:hypothetical protein